MASRMSGHQDTNMTAPVQKNTTPKIIVLISGRGSNLEAILAAQKFYDYRVSCVISDKKDATGLQIAAKYDVESICFDIPKFSPKPESRIARKEQKAALYAYLMKQENVALVCLAGFMQIVPEHIVAAFKGKIINIHPSLLPKFPGLDTHRRALEAGEQEHGASVHCVDAGVDTGKVIAQVAIPVEAAEDEASLARRVLKEEHRIYPWVISKVIKGQITLSEDSVTHTKEAESEAEKLVFTLG